MHCTEYTFSLQLHLVPSDLRKRDGSVVSWGGPRFQNFGGDSSRVQEQLQEVREIKATHSAFAALKAGWRWWEVGKNEEKWGQNRENGAWGTCLTQIQDLCPWQVTRPLAHDKSDRENAGWLWKADLIFSRTSLFFERPSSSQADGSVVCWGNSCEGGDCSRVAEQLKDVRQVCAAQRAFCALRADGSTVSWGVVAEGGGSYMVPGLKKIWLWLGGSFLELSAMGIHIDNWGAKELRIVAVDISQMGKMTVEG